MAEYKKRGGQEGTKREQAPRLQELGHRFMRLQTGKRRLNPISLPNCGEEQSHLRQGGGRPKREKRGIGGRDGTCKENLGVDLEGRF